MYIPGQLACLSVTTGEHHHWVAMFQWMDRVLFGWAEARQLQEIARLKHKALILKAEQERTTDQPLELARMIDNRWLRKPKESIPRLCESWNLPVYALAGCLRFHTVVGRDDDVGISAPIAGSIGSISRLIS